MEEVEQTETSAETPEVVEPEVTEQDQISEWLDDRLGPETEDAEEVEATKMPIQAPIVKEPEPAAAEIEAETVEPEETPRVSKAFSKVAKKEREVQQQKHQK